MPGVGVTLVVFTVALCITSVVSGVGVTLVVFTVALCITSVVSGVGVTLVVSTVGQGLSSEVFCEVSTEDKFLNFRKPNFISRYIYYGLL